MKGIKTASEFLQRANIVHDSRYQYDIKSFTGMKWKIGVICPVHTVFWPTASNHIHKKSGCPKCKGIALSIKNRLSINEFRTRATSVHGTVYDYSMCNYINSHTKIKIICLKHGTFHQTPLNHISRKAGCPDCKRSKGEELIASILDSHGVIFEQQKRFENCKGIRSYEFDFYLPEQKTIIEYDGVQHYKITNWGSNVYERNKKVDRIKTSYCYDNGINLIRVPYFKTNDILSILSSHGIIGGENGL